MKHKDTETGDKGAAPGEERVKFSNGPWGAAPLSPVSVSLCLLVRRRRGAQDQ